MKEIGNSEIFNLINFDLKLLKDHKVKYLIGVDEVGRGSLVGPVTASAVLFKNNLAMPCSWCIPLYKLNDSKKISEKNRQIIDFRLSNLAYRAIGEASVAEIDAINIYQATLLAMHRAINQLLEQLNINSKIKLDQVLIVIDGNMKIVNLTYQNIQLKQISIIKGDSKSASIASASVTAKVFRDSLITDLAKYYPQYNLAKNKGYATAFHRNAISKFGISEIHRKSFKI